MSQLTMALPHRTALGRADFLASASNAEALGWIDRWPLWPSGALLLHGPENCGKTHLAHLWRERSGAAIFNGEELSEAQVAGLFAQSRPPGMRGLALDDADRAAELALLHLYNCCREYGISLLLTARRSPGASAIALADLRSRLRAILAIAIHPPDDALLAAVLVKHFADRQLRVSPKVIAYLIPRIERSFAAAAELAARLDAAALTQRRPIRLPLVRRVLAAAPLHRAFASESGVT